MMMSRFSLFVGSLLFATYCLGDADLNTRQGQVTTADGKPIAGAVIRTIDAQASVREDQICPSIYPGLGKVYTTDADGKYELAELHPRLRYQVAIIAPGYKPHVIEEVSGWVAKPLLNKLQPAAEKLEAAGEVTGHVLDDNGKAIAGALIEFFGESRQGGQSEEFGTIADVDRYAVTSEDGVFVCEAKGDHRHFFTKVSAYGFAPQVVRMQAGPDAPNDNDVRMSRGCGVTGRLVKDGKPLAGVKMRLSQVNLDSTQCFGFFSIGTDDDGRFTFEHLQEVENFQIMAAINSLGSRGATPLVKATTAALAGQAVDVGDITVVPAVTINGKCIFPAGANVKGTAVYISSCDLDVGTATVNEDGTFKIPGIAPGSVSLNVSGPSLELSSENLSYYPPMRTMIGTVDKDTTLVLKLEPTAHEMHDTGGYSDEAYEAEKSQPLQGIPEEEK